MNKIFSSVGLNGTNRHDDTLVVQNLLRKKGFPFLRCDGICGRNTIKAILSYQRNFYHHPDGLVSPDKKTFELLSSTSDLQRSILPTPDGSTCCNPSGTKRSVNLMNPSAKCLDLMMKYESFFSHPYNDQNGEQITSYFDSDGNRIYGATVGYGHLITSESEFNKYLNGISLEQARTLFSADLVSIIRLVKNYLRVDLTQNEFDAIVMLSFNIGPGSPDPYHRRRSHNGLYYSKVLKIINGQSTDDLDKAWMGYSHAHHHVVQGLLNRRRSELNVYHKGIYIKL